MRSSIFLALFISLFAVVRTAPVPLEIGTVYGQDDLRDDTIVNQPGTHNPEHMAAIQAATTAAHNQILHMKNMLDNGHPDLHQHLVNAFGQNYNQAEIKKVVDKMATGRIDIGSTNVPNTGAQAHAVATTNGNAHTSRVMFMSQFHDMTPEAQAGTMVHEASHALGITKDYFSQEPNPPHDTKAISSLQGKGAPPGSDVKSGYIHQDFEHLKNTASNVMHKNADSYKVFAHTATNGLHAPLPQRFKPGCQPGAKKSANCNIL